MENAKHFTQVSPGLSVWFHAGEFSYYDEGSLQSATGSANFICSHFVLYCNPDDPIESNAFFQAVRDIESKEKL